MPRDWNFLINPFLTATEGSYTAMKKISSYTYDALASRIPLTPFTKEAGIATITLTPEQQLYQQLYNQLKPLIEHYNSVYEVWIASSYDKRGQTTRLSNLFTELRSEKIQEWDSVIQTVYKPKTAQYMRLLPHKRMPFQRGQQQQRLDALKLLSSQIVQDDNFENDFKAGVSNFYNELKQEYRNQTGIKTSERYMSMTLEPARKALAVCLYKTLGYLIAHLGEDPKKISIFFALEHIRRSEQSTYRQGIKAGAVIEVLKKSFKENDLLRLSNDGEATLSFWLAATATQAPGSLLVTLAPDSEKMVTAAELGEIRNRYLMARNESTVADGHYMVEVE